MLRALSFRLILQGLQEVAPPLAVTWLHMSPSLHGPSTITGESWYLLLTHLRSLLPLQKVVNLGTDGKAISSL